MRASTSFLSASLVALSTALLIPQDLRSRKAPAFPPLPLPHHVVYQFPDPTWLENLAIRSNGDILTTVLTAPHVYSIKPSQGPSQTPELLYTFPEVTSVIGITEVEHDIFYVGVQNYTPPHFAAVPGTSSVWEIDLRGRAPRVAKTVDIPAAVAFNGITTLSKAAGTILVADSALGQTWKVDVRARTYVVGPTVPEMKRAATGSPVGVNGLKIRDGDLYFDNSNLGALYRVPISAAGAVTGAVETLSTGLAPDDFILDHRGNAFICQNTRNIVSLRLANGTIVTVLGAAGSLDVPGPTAAKFGRKEWDRDVLYVTTTGGLVAPVNGTITEGGKIVAIDVKGIEDW